MPQIRRSALILLLALVSLAAACTQAPRPGGEVQAVAEPLLDSQLAGLRQNNFELYVKNYDEPMQVMLDRERFAKLREQIAGKLGTYKSRTYLGSLKKGRDTQVLWQAKFDKNDDDVLIRLVFTQKQGKNVILGLYFQ